ncbi:MAG: hypothetical protein NTW07_09150, partial [candidate division Zixibacteria bacterium]|nr:hypothetical protein [candidate division Zixibacteria bacterium]
MMRKPLFLSASMSLLLILVASVAVYATQDALVDRRDASRAAVVDQFNALGRFAPEVIATDSDIERNNANSGPAPERPVARSTQPVGSALSANNGIGFGTSVDLTYDDWQWGRQAGRYIQHYWNGVTGAGIQVDVHFVYDQSKDTLGDHTDAAGDDALSHKVTGYNVYNAVSPTNNWPLGQNAGCDLQGSDTAGSGNDANISISHAGLAVMAAKTRFFRNRADGTRLYQNMIFYQGERDDCFYDPSGPVNVTWVDTTVYRPNGLQVPNATPNYGFDPQITTSWDGTNVITHLLLSDDVYSALPDDAHNSSANTYKAFSYYRKVGTYAGDGTWSSGVALDTNWYHGYSMAVGQYPHHDKVAVSFTASTESGGLLNHAADMDCWIRESNDGGLNWVPSRSITNYQNGDALSTNHFTCWIDSKAIFDLNGTLHVVWMAKPTSRDPYFDGFNWNDFDENIYHWASNDPTAIVKIANGNFMNDDMLTGSMNTLHCGFAGVNYGYIAFTNISQCSDKLYVVWNQIHERANRFPWRNVAIQPAPGVLDDCAYNAPRLSAANSEIMMSVAKVSSPSLWDAPRNISNTYTPSCGLEGDADPDNLMRCGSEYKPGVELYGLDESGMSLHWPSPSNVVDLSPLHNYGGGYFLNMIYHDDQYPGSVWRQDLRGNTEWTLNSQKWIRIACVEPIEASRIDAMPEFINFPEWVHFGESNLYTITIVNEGNVVLKVTDISVSAGDPWL